LIPAEALRFVADQVDITPQHRREILVGLMPVALATMSVATIATTLMDEVRRRRLIVPGPFIVHQLNVKTRSPIITPNRFSSTSIPKPGRWTQICAGGIDVCGKALYQFICKVLMRGTGPINAVARRHVDLLQ
jgi:hypothetical protein